MTIRILSSEVASQIAAGEVIERPASVVKELLENSLDAGAHHITITIEGAGQRLVEIADDGQGIPADEMELAVARHATSKLQNAQDLFQIATLGFRGEALASIGSVAYLTLTSRPMDAPLGMRLRVEGGLVGSPEPVGAPVGTVVRVEDLFYNVPARRKFLKHEMTERRQIDALATQYALAYPHVRFELRQEGKLSVQTSGNGERREVMAALYGVEIARQMIEVISREDQIQVTGFISPTSLTRSNRRELKLFVNGRPVQDAALSAAVLQAYHTLLMVGRYPMGILFVELPTEEVDVNVHPAKAEVRFRDANRIFAGVQRAVRRALLAHSPVPHLGGAQLHWPESGDRLSKPPTNSTPTNLPRWGAAWDMAAGGDVPVLEQDLRREAVAGENAGVETGAQPPTNLPPANLLPARMPLLRLVGQVATAYLAAEGPDGLYLIDQHAAHERVLFERMMAQAGTQAASQAYLSPVTVELPPASARLLAEQLPALEHFGFQVETFGPNTFLVRAVPQLLSGMDAGQALKVLVEDFEEDETPLQAEREAKMIARVCKRAAVKAGQVLSQSEQQALLADLEACDSPRTCPHGRPTMIHLSVDLLERQFGRRGAR